MINNHVLVTINEDGEQVTEIITWTPEQVEQRARDEQYHWERQAELAESGKMRRKQEKLYPPHEQMKILRKGGAALVQMNQALDAVEAEAKQRAEEIRSSIPDKVAAVRTELEKELPNGTDRR